MTLQLLFKTIPISFSFFFTTYQFSERSQVIGQFCLHWLKNFFSNYFYFSTDIFTTISHKGAQWLSGRVLDSRPKGSGFEPHRCHCVVVLEQDTFILA